MRVIEQGATILDWSGLGLYERVETAARVCRRSESKGDAAGFVRSLVRRGHFPPLEFARGEMNWEGAGIYVFNVRRLREMLEANHISATAFLCASLICEEYPAFFEGVGNPYARTTDTNASWKPDTNWIPVLITTSRTISHQLVRYRRDVCFMQESQRHVRYDRDGIEVIEPPGLGMQVTRGIWYDAVVDAEDAYRRMMEAGATAEQARAVLPGCTATRILAYASPDEWRHIFGQRCDSHADPQMAALMEPLRAEMAARGLI